MRFKLILLLLVAVFTAHAQDIAFARKMVDTLTSPSFWGRGYTNEGLAKTASFLANEMQQYGLQPMVGKSFVQNFSYPVNSFPGKLEVNLNGKKLVPGQDFIVGGESRGVKCNGQLIRKDSTHFIDIKNRVVVELVDKLTFSVEQQVAGFTLLRVNKKALKEPPSEIDVNIQNKFFPEFKTSNLCGLVKGLSKPDSVILYTAHYDHLGGMGSKTYFPGANDNASGVAQLLSLAKYYVLHPQPYTVAFILFSGEEAGLEGSKYFTENPLIPLKSIRLLVNLDLEGTGNEGITVVNASVYPTEFAMLKNVNEQDKLLNKVNSRGKAANSDHYFFSEKGVPSFYLYTMGGIKAYHDIYDVSATLPMDQYEHLFKLLVDFNNVLMNVHSNQRAIASNGR